MRTNELMLYKSMEHGEILDNITFLMENYDNEYYNREDLKSLLFECIHELLELSVRHGFEGNLWHTYLTFLLASDENAYSTSCEIVGAVDGSINAVALHDFEVMKELFDYDFAAMEQTLEAGCFAILRDYRHTNGNSKVFNTRIRNRICDLSRALAETESAEAFQETMTQFYREFGVGKLGLHKAFRVEHPAGGRAEIVPITNIAHVHLDDLVGYEIAKQKLIENTEAFVEGRKANNCLLYGDAGTGKSSSIKAILNQYYDKGIHFPDLLRRRHPIHKFHLDIHQDNVKLRLIFRSDRISVPVNRNIQFFFFCFLIFVQIPGQLIYIIFLVFHDRYSDHTAPLYLLPFVRKAFSFY